MDSTFIYVVLLIFGLGMAFGLFMRHTFLEERYGEQAAKRLVPRQVIEFLAFFLLLSAILLTSLDKFSVTIRAALGALGALEMCAALLWSVLFRLRAGPTELDLGKLDQASLWYVAFLVFYGLVRLTEPLIRPESGIDDVSISILIFSLAADQLLRNMFYTRITATGIYTRRDQIKWGRIKSYDWLENTAQASTLMLNVKSWLPFSVKPLRIPAVHKETVDDLLVRHVPSAHSSVK